MGSLFGGKKREKAMEAMQARQTQQALTERAALQAEKADIAGAGRKVRAGRSALRSSRSGALKQTLGG